VANRNKGRRGRSRKRRRAATSAGEVSAGTELAGVATGSAKAQKRPAQSPAAAGRARRSGATQRSAGAGSFREPQSFGERPQAPWHPLPLSELLILVGAIGTVVGLQKGVSDGGPPLFAGLAAVLIGTVEVTLREHLSGYRKHTLILALIPVIVFHSAVVLIVGAFTPAPRVLNIGLLVIDAGLFAILFKLLGARFQDARRERVFAGRR
jgi:hypothetical protein